MNNLFIKDGIGADKRDMIKNCAWILLLVTFSNLSHAQTIIGNQTLVDVPVTAGGSTNNALVWLPPTYTTDAPTKTYPLILNLHGAGDAGNDINQLLNPGLLSRSIADGFVPQAVNPVDGQNYQFIVVSPHAPGWSEQYSQIQYILPWITSHYRVDPDRIYIAGLSAGGYGAWTTVTDSSSFSLQLAAIAPLSAASIESSRVPNVVNAATNSLPVWSIVGTQDSFYASSVDYTNRVNNASPSIPAKLTPLLNVGHSAWIEAFDPNWRNSGLSLYEWFLQYKRGVQPPANARPSLSMSSPTNNSVSTFGSAVNFNATASDTDGGIARVEFYEGSTLLGSVTTAPYTFAWQNPSVGNHFLSARAVDNVGAVTNSDTALITVLAQSGVSAPYGGTARSIPGTIQSEDYDIGGQGIAYSDTDATNNLNWYRWYDGVDTELTVYEPGSNQYYVGGINAGEWMKYTVNVATSGIYTLQARVSAPSAGKSFRVEVDGSTVATVNVPNTGDWQTWQTTSIAGVSLTSGTHVLRFYAITNGFNINWLSFALQGANNPPAVAVTAPLNNANFVAPATVGVTASASDSDGTISKVDFYNGTTLLGTSTASPYTFSWNNVAAGTYSLTAVATDNSGAATTSAPVAITVATSTVSTPFGGTPRAIPGTIQVEDYDSGGQNVAYYDATSGNSGGAYRTSEAVDIEGTPDTGGGYDLGWTTQGEWLKYTVNIASTNTYTLQARVSTPNNGTSIQVLSDDVAVGTITLPNTAGWQSWRTVSTSVSLTAGTHVLKLLMNTTSGTDVGKGFNLNWMSFAVQGVNTPPTAALTSPANNASFTAPANIMLTASAGDSDGTVSKVDFYNGSTLLGTATTSPYTYSWNNVSAGTYTLTAIATDNLGATTTSTAASVTVTQPAGSTPYGGSPRAVPGTIQFEDYDSGGQNVAYFDTTSGNTGGAYRTGESADVESTPDGGYDLGWTIQGEWLNYTVNVATARSYTLKVRVATPNTGKSIQILSDGTSVGTLTLPSTGGWQTWTTVTGTITLPAGTHILRILMNTGSTTDAGKGFNLNWFSLN